MDFNKFTQNSISVLNGAQSLAKNLGNSSLEQEHIFYEMLDKKTLI